MRKYGRDWFSQAFLSEANLGGILRQGPLDYLQQQLDESDDEDLAIVRAIRTGKVSVESAADQLGFIARVVLENYDEYRDYNTTTPQSDYGDNLHLLIDLLAHKVEFERHRWGQEPTYIAHSVLLEEGRFGLAAMVREDFDRRTTLASRAMLSQLESTEEKAGFRLQSIRGRLAEGFVGPLRLDEVLALARRSVPLDATSHGRGVDDRQAFSSLLEAVEELTQEQHGAGIEVPDWLRRLESCVDDVLDAREGRVLDYEDLVPAVGEPAAVRWEEFLQQMSGLEATDSATDSAQPPTKKNLENDHSVRNACPSRTETNRDEPMGWEISRAWKLLLPHKLAGAAYRLATILSEFPRDVRSLGLRSAWILLWVDIEHWLRRVFQRNELDRVPRDLVKIRLKGYAHPLWIRRNSSDRFVVRQVFRNGEYGSIDLAGPIRRFVDAGANIGCASFYLLHRYPDSEGDVIEADPENFALCQKNLAPFGVRVRLHGKGVWPRSIPLRLVRPSKGQGLRRRFRSLSVRQGKRATLMA